MKSEYQVANCRVGACSVNWSVNIIISQQNSCRGLTTKRFFFSAYKRVATKRVYFCRHETSCHETSFFFLPRNECPRNDFFFTLRNGLPRNDFFFRHESSCHEMSFFFATKRVATKRVLTRGCRTLKKQSFRKETTFFFFCAQFHVKLAVLFVFLDKK